MYAIRSYYGDPLTDPQFYGQVSAVEHAVAEVGGERGKPGAAELV